MTNTELPLLMLQLSLRESDLIYAEERVEELESIINDIKELIDVCLAEHRAVVPILDLKRLLEQDRYAKEYND